MAMLSGKETKSKRTAVHTDEHEKLSKLTINLPSWTATSPIAQAALLQTEMNSGLRFCDNIGIMSWIAGLTCWKQAFVKSPRRANELCRTSSPGSWKSNCIQESDKPSALPANVPPKEIIHTIETRRILLNMYSNEKHCSCTCYSYCSIHTIPWNTLWTS